jgi:hypothetical protein
MSAFQKFYEELTKRDFLQFLEEKQIHPSDLISFSIKLKKGLFLNEEQGDSGFLSALGGAFRGLYHGFRAGWGSRNINTATNTLKKQLLLAYEKFLDSLTMITGDKSKSLQIVANLRRNAEQDIDKYVFNLSQPKEKAASDIDVGEIDIPPEKNGKETPAEEGTPEPTEPTDDDSPPPAPEEEEEEFAPVPPAEEESGVPDEEEEGGEEEGEEGEEEDDEFSGSPPSSDPIEEDELKTNYHKMLTNKNTSDIHTQISNDFPSKRGRDKTLTLDTLIELLNENELNEAYVEEGLNILRQIISEFYTANRKLTNNFISYVERHLSEKNRNKLFPSDESSGREITQDYNQKINIIKTKAGREFIIDNEKLMASEDLAGNVAGDPSGFLSGIDGRSARVIQRNIKNQKIANIDSRNIIMKIIVDDRNNFILLSEDDIKKYMGIA